MSTNLKQNMNTFELNNKLIENILIKKINVIVSYTFNKQGIGINGKLAWHIPEDIEHFKSITTNGINNIVIMGRVTWDSILNKYKPLSNRFNVVLSNNEEYKKKQREKYIDHKNIIFTTWDKFFTEEYIKIEQYLYSLSNYSINYNNVAKYFIIGGSKIYERAIESKMNLIIYSTEIYTRLNNIIECDSFFPKIDNQIITSVSPFIKFNNQLLYRFITSTRIISCENNNIIQPFTTTETIYLNIMQKILDTGTINNDRTGVGTLSVFGEMLKYNLRDTFPISTTKRIFFRAIFEELMLYISGKTDNAILQEKGIHVWDGNTSREFLDKRGLHNYPIGDMGQTYGFNMRHYGGKYIDCKTIYPEGYGYDQLANIINLIKTDPYSRRIIIDLWEPSSINNAALPSCLCKYQFNVNVMKKELNLAIYLRSSDYFLANNWNTCTGALFVHLLCNLEDIDLTPGDLTVFIADAHIYTTHINQVKQNLERSPLPYPKLLIDNKKKNILEFKFEDLELIGYKSYPNIKAEMAI